MASCDHLCTVEEQLRELLAIVNDHLKMHEPDEDVYGSLLAVTFHVNEALHELGYLLDQADGEDALDPTKEVGH